MQSRPNRHDWNGLEDYLATHDRWIRAWGHFIHTDAVKFELRESVAIWNGSLYCDGDLEIRVFRVQEVRRQHGRILIRNRQYSYHVRRYLGRDTTNLFRYDNVGQHDAPDGHHRHQYENGVEESPPRAIRADEWPTLGEVITEAWDWWQQQSKK